MGMRLTPTTETRRNFISFLPKLALVTSNAVRNLLLADSTPVFGYPPPPRSIGINTLARNSRQNLEATRVTGKILILNELVSAPHSSDCGPRPSGRRAARLK